MVNAKQTLHVLIDRLSKEQAEEALAYLGAIAGESDGVEGPDTSHVPDRKNPLIVLGREFRMRPTADWRTLAAQQGVKPIERLEDLFGDFWPEDETADDFIAACKRWRCEGCTGDDDC